MTDPVELLDVSSEMRDKLDRYAALVRRWNRSINIVSARSMDLIEKRYIPESLHLGALMPLTGKWVDLGSGGGFPAVPIAILAGASIELVLIESDQRKCEFLRTARRELELEFKIEHRRIEFVPPANADVITSRGLAPLTILLHHVHRHGREGTRSMFPKGRSWPREVSDARLDWQFRIKAVPSITDSESAVLVVENVLPVVP